jgi:hypothetical protein
MLDLLSIFQNFEMRHLTSKSLHSMKLLPTFHPNDIRHLTLAAEGRP